MEAKANPSSTNRVAEDLKSAKQLLKQITAKVVKVRVGFGLKAYNGMENTCLSK